ncbi:methyltransferase [Hypoxylon crocopeplum]|nr:methyltransferase [Hypoxylon crocopeplum]
MAGESRHGESRHYTDAPYTKVYTPSALTRWYDFMVLRINMKYMWRCPTDSVLLPFFSENFSRRHLDCGVASGWFPYTALSRPFRVHATQHLTLLDYNEDALRISKSRVLSATTNTTIDCVVADVKAPLPDALKDAKFDSISMFNLFHCIPGSSKFQAFGTYKHLLAEDGVLTGCTILGEKYATRWLGRWLLKKYNRLGYFNNLEDNEEDIRQILEKEFEEVETWLIGMMLLFRVSKPRTDL